MTRSAGAPLAAFLHHTPAVVLARTAGAMKAFAGCGGIAANTRISIRSNRRDCRCSLRSTASSGSRTDSSTTRSARNCGRMAAAPPIAAVTSQAPPSTAVPTDWRIQRRWARRCRWWGPRRRGWRWWREWRWRRRLWWRRLWRWWRGLGVALHQPRLPYFAHPQGLVDAAHDLVAAPGATVAPDRKQIIGRGWMMAVCDRRGRRHADHGNRPFGPSTRMVE